MPEGFDHFDEHHPNERLVFDDEYRCLPHLAACLTRVNNLRELTCDAYEEYQKSAGAEGSLFLTIVNWA